MEALQRLESLARKAIESGESFRDPETLEGKAPAE